MSEKNRNTIIIVVIIAAAVLLFTDPNGITRTLTTINLIASTVFYIVAAIWLVRRL
jgi:hypothetical protein